MAAVRSRFDQLDLDPVLVLVTFTSRELIDAYIAERTPGAIVVNDPDRHAYRAFKLGRGSVSRIWGARTARRYVELLAHSGWRSLRRPTEDTRQLGGDFIIDAQGIVAWEHRGAGPDDRPAVDDLVDAYCALAR